MTLKQSIHSIKRNSSYKDIWTKYAIFILCASLALVAIGCGGKAAEPTAFWPVKYNPTIEDFQDVVVDPYPHVASVRVVLDTYAPLYENRISDSLANVKGIGDFKVNAELRVIELLPEEGENYLDLYDIKESINAIRGVKVIRMDVLAVGELSSFTVDHTDFGPDPYRHKRYRAVVGDQANQVFVLAENNRLDEVLEYNQAILIGQVSAFEGESPILQITDFAPVKG